MGDYDSEDKDYDLGDVSSFEYRVDQAYSPVLADGGFGYDDVISHYGRGSDDLGVEL